jgi:hypothetical protein
MIWVGGPKVGHPGDCIYNSHGVALIRPFKHWYEKSCEHLSHLGHPEMSQEQFCRVFLQVE